MSVRDAVMADYYDWLCSIAMPSLTDRAEYSRLLQKLDSIDFRYSIPRDSNREVDGIDLRYEWGNSPPRYSQNIIAMFVDNRPCSVLEMMVALAKRCENEIMYNPEYGDETSHWFKSMLGSLGLLDMTDYRYDENKVDYIINRFLDRQYNYDGSGGLFTVTEPKQDMRTVEIWYQANWYFTSILENEGDIL